MDELFILRYGKFERIPDLVVWPGNIKYKHKSKFIIIFHLIYFYLFLVSQSEVETLVNLV